MSLILFQHGEERNLISLINPLEGPHYGDSIFPLLYESDQLQASRTLSNLKETGKSWRRAYRGPL